jgi:hypothetical protein
MTVIHDFEAFISRLIGSCGLVVKVSIDIGKDRAIRKGLDEKLTTWFILFSFQVGFNLQ